MLRIGMISRRAGTRRLWCTAGLILAVDQLSKLVVLAVLDLPAVSRMDVLPGFVHLRFAWNTGINFGLLESNLDVARFGLAALAVVLSLLLVVYALGERRGLWIEIALGLVVGGALGNALDRLLHGAVVDFLNVTCCGIYNPYSFNLADVAVFAGALGYVLFTWLHVDERERRLIGNDGTLGNVLFAWLQELFAWLRELFAWVRELFAWVRVLFAWLRVLFAWLRVLFAWLRKESHGGQGD